MNDKNREFIEIIQLFFMIVQIIYTDLSNKAKIYLKYPLVQFRKNCNFVVSAIEGQVPERSNGADCKSAGLAFGGSNPSLPTKLRAF